MKKRGLGATATLWKTRCRNCPLKSEKQLKKEGRGSVDLRTEKNTGIVVCAWNDNRAVTAASNIQSVEPLDSCKCYNRKTKTYVHVRGPNIIEVDQPHHGRSGQSRHASFILRQKSGTRDFAFILLTLQLWTHSSFTARQNQLTYNWWTSNYMSHLVWCAPKMERPMIAVTSHLSQTFQLLPLHPRHQFQVPPWDQKERSTKTYQCVMTRLATGRSKWLSKNASTCKLKSCTRQTRFFGKKCSVYLCIDREKSTALKFFVPLERFREFTAWSPIFNSSFLTATIVAVIKSL